MIRWLHISDLHLGNDDMSSSRMRDKLLTILTEKIGHMDYVFLTGDIRTANMKDNRFTQGMADFIKDVCSHCGIGTERLFIVPGNHDINRDIAGRDDAIRKVKFERKGYYDSKSGKINNDDLAAIWRGQEDFRNFLSLLYSPEQLANYENQLAPNFVVETDDFNIIHLDTTVTYTKGQEAHDLIIGTKYLYEIVKTLNKKKPSILLTHYPIISLLQDEKNEVSNILLENGVRLWLCGHEHDQNLLPYKYLHVLQAGEVQYERNGRASFLIGEYDSDSFRCKVYAYAWFDEGWAKYPFVNLDSENTDTYEFELRPLDTDCVPLLTNKARKANEPSIQRLTPNLDRNLFCRISYEGASADIQDILNNCWKYDCKNIILLGEGGMGKSTMLLDFCKTSLIPALYISAEQLASLGIGLVEYCRITLFDGSETDFNKVLFDKYGSQSLIVIIDGLNEVNSANEGKFINEIQRLNLYKGIQIVIASRTDFTIRYNLTKFRKVYLEKLNDDTLQTLFTEKEWSEIIASPNLHRLLRNPMLVTIYKEICSVIDEYRNIEFLDWRLPVDNATDLFYNYYLVQIALIMKRIGPIGDKIRLAIICIDQILPAIAYRFEITYSINKPNGDFRTILNDVLQQEKIDEGAIIEVKDFYRIRNELRLNYGAVSDMLIDELHLLHRDTHTTSFGHQMYRDYLSAKYIIDKTVRREAITDIWNTRIFPLPISCHIKNGSWNYWNGIALNVKGEGEKDKNALTLINNLFLCFPSTTNGCVADFSNLNLTSIQLPNLESFEKKVLLKNSRISDTTLGINKKEGKPFHVLSISPDHTFLAAAFGTSMVIYNLHENSQIFRYDLGKTPTQMMFYDRYLIINAGVFVVFLFAGDWRYVGEINNGSNGIFNSKLKAIIAIGDDLHIYYNNRNFKFNLMDCSRTLIENKNHNDVKVADGTNLMPLSRSIDVRKATEKIYGTVAITTMDSLTAKSYADGRIEISSECELVSVLGERNTILLDAGISRDGSKAVTLSFETFGKSGELRRIQIWDINRKLKIGELLCVSEIFQVNLSENGRWILGKTTNSTWIYDITNQKGLWIEEIFVSNQQGKLITYGDYVMRKTPKGKLYLYNLSNGEIKDCISPYKNPSMVYLLKNGHIAAVDESGRYLKFIVNRRGDIMTIRTDDFDNIIGVQEFKNQPFIVVAANNGLISVYHTGTGQRTRKLDNNYKVRLTTSHLNKTIMAHSDGHNRLTIDYYYEEIWAGDKRRGWWRHFPYKGRIDSHILDFAFNEQDESLIVILANGKILFLSEDKCQFKGNAHIVVAFNTDAYDFSGAICSKEIAEILRQNNCLCDNLIVE